MKEYKYLGKLQALSIMFMLASLVLSHKIVEIFGIKFSAASIIFPNTILITNIVAIVYGFEHSANIMWETLKAQIPFTIVCFIGINLPSSASFNEAAYQVVFSDIWQVSLASLLGTYIGFKANIYALSKFDLLLLYKGFWLKSLYACGVGEFIFTLVAVPLMFIGKVSIEGLISIVFTSLIIKFVYSSFLSYLAEFIARWLSVNENIKYKETSFNYDPFKLKSMSAATLERE